MTKSGYYYIGDTSRGELCYDILENGFEIFIGESAKYPSYRQTEPFIPNPDVSYEENAILYCKGLSVEHKTIDHEEADQLYASHSDIENLRSDIDYLMLLTDADSATEEETE